MAMHGDDVILFNLCIFYYIHKELIIVMEKNYLFFLKVLTTAIILI